MILEALSKEHKRWWHMALSICSDDQLADDIVQDMYIRIEKYVDEPDKIINPETSEINSFYIFVTMKNIYFHWFNQRMRMSAFEVKDFDFFSEEEYNDGLCSDSLDDEANMLDMEYAHQQIVDSIAAEIKGWHWYDEKLFKLYFMTDMSLRDIAAETKISLSSIYNSIKNLRDLIKDKFGEDVEDYFNRDYDKI
jgi:RNA polymerase sigma factor (sigma-70 family)